MHELLPGLNAAPNIHPMLVHFAVALWPLALFLAIAAAMRSQEDLSALSRGALGAGTAMALLAVASGFSATNSMGHDAPGHDLVHVHRNLMIAATVLAALSFAFAWRVRHRSDVVARWGIVAALTLVNGVAVAGADRGVLLVFGYGVGTARLQTPDGGSHAHGGDRPAHVDPAAAPGLKGLPAKTDDRALPQAEAAPHGHGADHAH